MNLDKYKCPICKKRFSDILQHFAIYHEIRDMERLNKEIRKAEEKEMAKHQFNEYVDELKKKMKNGEISAQDYRNFVSQWQKNRKVNTNGRNGRD